MGAPEATAFVVVDDAVPSKSEGEEDDKEALEPGESRVGGSVLTGETTTVAVCVMVEAMDGVPGHPSMPLSL